MRTELVCCTYEFVNDNSNFKLSLDINKLKDADDAVVAYFMELSQHMSVWTEQNHEEFWSIRFSGQDSIPSPLPPPKI
jgi:hypothetical protein